MTKYIINGSFLCSNLSGIERFSFEICRRLDSSPNSCDFGIFIPKNAKSVPQYKNIKIYKSRRILKSYFLFTNFVYGMFLIRRRAIGIDFANTCSVLKPGVVFLHDIYCKIKLYDDDFKTPRDKRIKFISCFMYRFIVRHAKKIITVSEFSKNQISQTYKISPEKISVVPNGWDHFKAVDADYSVFEKNPFLRGDFYFTLGSLSKRKNLKWILEYAKRHPCEIFAVSGNSLDNLRADELNDFELPNVHFLGYLSDGQAKALMSKCKAFVFPSYYEGFGIPPLEALSSGAKIVVSNATCLPEIYGNAAHYINPYDYDVNLDDLLSEPVEPPDGILRKYTYDNAVELFLKILS